MAKRLTLLVIALILVASCGGTAGNVAVQHDPVNERRTALIEKIEAVRPFFSPMGKPGPNDWLAHFHERGQTFEEYVEDGPPNLSGRRKIYVLPLGKFSSSRQRVMDVAVEYINVFYGLPVETMPAKQFQFPLRNDVYRTVDYPEIRQIRTGYIIEAILKPEVPEDAAGLVAFTNEDLFADSSGLFVFGQASMDDRAAVWSLSRLDDSADATTLTRRTLKISVHELGHLFNFRHCTKYECVMSGTNHLAETDSRPIDACPECMAKIAWLTGIEPAERYDALASFAERNKLASEAAAFRQKAAAIRRVRN